jgi:hypothetical protein
MGKTQDKVIITCAVTGAIHTPSISSYLPLIPDQIVEQSIEAAQAGAAILHLHARKPSDGQPTPAPAPAIFDNPRQFWPPFFTWLDFRQFEAGHRHEGGSPQVEQRGVVAKSVRCSGTAHPCVLARLHPGSVQPLPAYAQKLYAY